MKYKLGLKTTHWKTLEPTTLYFHQWEESGPDCCPAGEIFDDEEHAYIFSSLEELNKVYWRYWPEYKNKLKIIEVE